MQAGQDYRGGLSAEELVSTLKDLLSAEQSAMRLTCRYLADLADSMEGKWAMAGAGTGVLTGYADVYHAARCLFGLSAHTTRERIRVGRALRSLPRIEEAFLSRELSYSRAREVTRVATPGDESAWLILARELPIRTLERRVAEAAGKSPRVRPADPVQVRLRRSATVEVTLQLPAETWALLQRAMEGARRASEASLCDAEALEAVARDALALQSTDVHGADPHRPDIVHECPSCGGAELGPRGGPTPPASRQMPTPSASHSGTSAAPGGPAGRSTPPASRKMPTRLASRSGTATVPVASHSGTAPAPIARRSEGAIVAALDASENASALLALLGQGGRWTMDALIEATGLRVSDVSCALVGLELEGRIQQSWGGDYRMCAGKA
ncbi:MAG: hypothetical protein R3B70_31260 [Polyangiaceae bacterium]